MLEQVVIEKWEKEGVILSISVSENGKINFSCMDKNNPIFTNFLTREDSYELLKYLAGVPENFEELVDQGSTEMANQIKASIPESDDPTTRAKKAMQELLKLVKGKK